jgi:hypothetical protein
MARQKASKNQLIVAEALRLAREESFHKGLSFLEKNIDAGNPILLENWFTDKCNEHGIATPAMASK